MMLVALFALYVQPANRLPSLDLLSASVVLLATTLLVHCVPIVLQIHIAIAMEPRGVKVVLLVR